MYPIWRDDEPKRRPALWVYNTVKGWCNMNAVGLKNFTQEVIDSPEPVLVDFWADFCAPCRQLKPVLQAVADTGAKVVTVDITEEPELAAHYNVSAIPTLLVFKNGQPGNRVIGLKRKEDLIHLLNA